MGTVQKSGIENTGQKARIFELSNYSEQMSLKSIRIDKRLEGSDGLDQLRETGRHQPALIFWANYNNYSGNSRAYYYLINLVKTCKNLIKSYKHPLYYLIKAFKRPLLPAYSFPSS